MDVAQFSASKFFLPDAGRAYYSGETYSWTTYEPEPRPIRCIVELIEEDDGEFSVVAKSLPGVGSQGADRKSVV